MNITSFRLADIRFPTSVVNAGSDAVHKDPDYSAAYVILETDGPHQGHGFAFTIGRGNEVVVEAIRALEPLVVGKTLEEISSDPGAFWKLLADMSPAEIVKCIDFRYITDALTPDEAREMLERRQATHDEREAILVRDGYPGYTTSAG